MLHPVNMEQVQPTLVSLLKFLDTETIAVPGNMVEAVVGGKSLLRALISEQLVLAQVAQEAAASMPEPEDPEEESEKAA